MANTRSAEKVGAVSQLGALRDRLAEADAKFNVAAQVERDAETLCDKVRAELKARRLTLGLKQQELAERIEIGHRYLAHKTRDCMHNVNHT